MSGAHEIYCLRWLRRLVVPALSEGWAAHLGSTRRLPLGKHGLQLMISSMIRPARQIAGKPFWAGGRDG